MNDVSFSITNSADPSLAWIGRRKTLLAYTAIFAAGAVCYFCFVPPLGPILIYPAQVLQTMANGEGHRGLGYIYAGRIISGFGIGAISAVAPAYVCECSPTQVRGRITGMFQIMVAIGVMLSYFINCTSKHIFTRFLLYSEEIFDAHGFIPVGIGLHIHNSSKIWRIPFAFQFVPAGIMALGLLTVPESPRWLASKSRSNEALKNLAYLRRRLPSSQDVLHELAEIEAALAEEREVRANLGLREAFFGRGNFPRFLIAFFIFFLQQWCGQNSVNYYAPQIFTSVSNVILFALAA